MFNILVVEDDKNLKKLMITYLKKNSYNTFEANNGMEALDIIDKNYIDLIISDIMMPQMDGYELLKSLRESKYEIPILLITAKSSFEDKREGFVLGADDYMVKPINMEEMILRVQVLSKRTRRANEIDLTEQIQKTIALLEPKWKEKQLTISFSPNNSYFYGDENLIFQVWVNLIDNAIKFSKDKGTIEISIQESQDEIIIKIKDNGIGMNKEDIKKIFTRFYQVDTSHSGKGSGLGLSIVKRIIVLSNGTINVESQKDVGTTIIVKLPKLNQINKILIL